MRDTFIGVFGGIVLIVSMLCFALMRLTLGDDASGAGQARTAVHAAAAQLEFETLRVERWLAVQATDPASHDAFEAASPEGRGDVATKFADLIAERAKSASAEISDILPTGIYVFDAKGIVLGRDNSKLSRGENLGEFYPDMLKKVLAGQTGSALWLSTALKHQMLASYAPIRDAKGAILGGIVLGRPLVDRLKAANSASNETALFAAVPGVDGMQVFAKTDNATEEMNAGIQSSKEALGNEQTAILGNLPAGHDGAARALASYGNGRQAVIVAVVRKPARASLLVPFAIALVIGLVLVATGAHLVDKYVSQPVADLEEGLLAVLNGQADIRFELEHKLYGGLVFRLNSLLNQLTGVQEDNTDEEGRPSTVPGAVHAPFTAPLHLEERHAAAAVEDVEGALALREIEPEDYYKNLYDEYLAGQKKVGSPTDVKFAQFTQRIKQLELQLTNTHSRPFRLAIEVDDKDVIFVAMPME